MNLVASSPASTQKPHTVSVVIPVYQGEHTLESLLREIEPLTHGSTTSSGQAFTVNEVILVHDGAIDRSDETMLRLAKTYAFVQLIWLSRNFGQHPATLAGMASATGEWVATMDEDGQQSPADIAAMLDTALQNNSQLVYAKPLNPPPHGLLRNMLSACAKFLVMRFLGFRSFGKFHSFRLIDGEIARSLAAYCGNNVYLDIALFWIVARTTHCPVRLRDEGKRASGYSLRTLVQHFWRLVMTSGTRPLRLIQLLGTASIVLSIAITVYALWMKFTGLQVQGWASLVIVMAFFSGCILFSLGIIAEYLAVALNIVMGKPLYLVSSKPPRRNNSSSS